MDILYTNLGTELLETLFWGDNGSARSFLNSLDTIKELDVKFETASGFNRSRRESLRTAMKDSKFLPSEVESATNMVYRPSFIHVKKTVERKRNLHSMPNVLPEVYTCEETARFSDYSDIGVAVVDDIAGRKVVTMLASIYFARYRFQEIVCREEVLVREQRPVNWSSRLRTNESRRSYTNTVIVMAPEELACKWEKAASDAYVILGIENAEIFRNPAAINRISNGVSVVVFTSVENLRHCFPLGFVPVIVVDEFVAKDKHNIVTRDSREIPVYGRLILASKDTGNISRIITGSNKSSLVRRTICAGVADNASLKNDVILSSTLLSCGTLSSYQRRDMVDSTIEELTHVQVEKYTVFYNEPTWSVLDVRHQLHFESLGLFDMHSVNTVGDIINRIRDSGQGHDEDLCTTDLAPALVEMMRRIDSFTSESAICHVCLDPYAPDKEVCMISPCWHFVCKKCMHLCLHQRQTCPVCRVDIVGVTDVLPDAQSAPNCSFPRDDCTSLLDYLGVYLSHKHNMVISCASVVASMVRESDSSNILVISDVPDFSTCLRESLNKIVNYIDGRVKIEQLVVPRKRKKNVPIFESQVEWFNDRTEDVVKVLCTHEKSNDGIPGLDLPKVDAICKVGAHIEARRLLRVTGDPRSLGKDGIFRIFDIVPVKLW